MASSVLETLQITNDDLEMARSDSSLMETLAITYELLTAFDDAGVLDTFFRLPRRDQGNFLRWIGATDDSGVRDHRTETFVSALQAAPLDLRPPTEETRDRSRA